MSDNEIIYIILQQSYRIHSALGQGLFEQVYEEFLFHKLVSLGFKVERQRVFPIELDNIKVNKAFRVDLIVEDRIVIEVKCVEAIHPAHVSQILNYLRFGDYKIGLILNFRSSSLKNGIKRVIRGQKP